MSVFGEAEAEAVNIELSAEWADCLVGVEAGVPCWEKGIAVERVIVAKRSSAVLVFIVIEWVLVVALSFVVILRVEEVREMLNLSA